LPALPLSENVLASITVTTHCRFVAVLLAAVLPPTPETAIACPVTSPWLALVMTIGVALVAAVMAPESSW
jgi:hypothetical protein